MYQSFKDHLQTGSQRPGVRECKIRDYILEKYVFLGALF